MQVRVEMARNGVGESGNDGCNLFHKGKNDVWQRYFGWLAKIRHAGNK